MKFWLWWLLLSKHTEFSTGTNLANTDYKTEFYENLKTERYEGSVKG